MRRTVLILLTAIASACLGGARPDIPFHIPSSPASLTLRGQFSIAPLGRFPPEIGLLFGGISGLARAREDNEMLGVSDAQRGGRIYRFRLEGTGDTFRVAIADVIVLEFVPGDGQPDHEGLVLLPNGNFLVSSEGTGREPRRPPGITEHGPQGQFVRRIPVPDKYVPEPTGSMTRGARGNAGFESLTLTPDGRHLFTATETALVQDGEPASFDVGTRARILEYATRDGIFEPSREFVYEIERLERPAYKPGTFINGLVDLLALNDTTLLALERGFVEDVSRSGPSVNQIRLFRISTAGATDVSAIDSLKDRPEVVPVRKTLLLDLSKTPGLSPDLAPSLDNFEGLGFGPMLPGGRPSIVLVSDDNFGASQRTWFLMFAIE